MHVGHCEFCLCWWIEHLNEAECSFAFVENTLMWSGISPIIFLLMGEESKNCIIVSAISRMTRGEVVKKEVGKLQNLWAEWGDVVLVHHGNEAQL